MQKLHFLELVRMLLQRAWRSLLRRLSLNKQAQRPLSYLEVEPDVAEALAVRDTHGRVTVGARMPASSLVAAVRLCFPGMQLMEQHT